MSDTDILKIALGGYVPIIIGFTIAIWQRGQRIKESIGQAEAARAESAQLRGQLADLKSEQSRTLDNLGKKHDGEIQRKQDEINKLHNRIKDLEKEVDFDEKTKRYYDEMYGEDK